MCTLVDEEELTPQHLAAFLPAGFLGYSGFWKLDLQHWERMKAQGGDDTNPSTFTTVAEGLQGIWFAWYGGIRLYRRVPLLETS